LAIGQNVDVCTINTVFNDTSGTKVNCKDLSLENARAFSSPWEISQFGPKIPTRIEKNTTILSNRSKILQKRNKHSDYHIMIKYLSHYNNFIVNGPCNEKIYI
jgi:hypothetical protein